jgi:hypothetical protein
MELSLKKVGEKIFAGYVCLVGLWIVSALSFQLFFVYLELSGQSERAAQYGREIEWKIDGTFKDNPDNIWYEGPAKSK